MNIREIENLIVEKLQQNFSDFQVIGFPEKPQEYILLHPIGAILVHYRGGSYSSTNSINFVSQDKKMEFGVTVVTRNLRSNSGSYEALDKIKNVLCGYKIAGCTKLTPTKENFISEQNGIWQYEILFTLTTPSIEEMEEI